jgi:hypothetical protein
MKPRIPFRIGYQYSNWELDLDAGITDKIPDNRMYVSYLWIGKNKPFLNFTPDRTELIFYWDRLSAVILRFEQKGNNFRHELQDVLTARLGSPIAIAEYEMRYKFMGANNIEYWYICTRSNSLLVVYGESDAISHLLPVLSFS